MPYAPKVRKVKPPETRAGYAVLNLKAADDQPYVLHIWRNPPLPPPNDKTWAIATTITNDGGIETSAWLTVSGRHHDTPDASGHHRVRQPSDAPYMGGFWSDVDGPTLVLRGNDLPHSRPLSIIDDATGQESARINNDGSIKCKSIECRDGMTGEFSYGPFKLTLRGGIVVKLEGPGIKP